jgi:hypothetical protein
MPAHVGITGRYGQGEGDVPEKSESPVEYQGNKTAENKGHDKDHAIIP